MTEDFYAAFIPQVTAACAQMVQGNPEPWLAMWARRDPVSVFGSFGYASTGWPAVSATVRKAAARMSGGGDYGIDIQLAEFTGDYAYTVAIETYRVSSDGGPVAETKLRVTQIYRREDGAWKVAHRHGDVIRPDYPIE